MNQIIISNPMTEVTVLALITQRPLWWYVQYERGSERRGLSIYAFALLIRIWPPNSLYHGIDSRQRLFRRGRSRKKNLLAHLDLTYIARYSNSRKTPLTLPQELQVLVSPWMLAPQEGQALWPAIFDDCV
jgi:hypothetical protein